MINARDLKWLVIKPTLKLMVPFWGEMIACDAAVNLLVGTARQESHIAGEYRLIQVGGGPGRGIYQIEAETHVGTFTHYLNYSHRNAKKQFILSLGSGDQDLDLVGNLIYQTAIARLKYWRCTFKWPHPENVSALAEIWDKFYNANDDHGFPSDFIEHFPLDVVRR